MLCVCVSVCSCPFCNMDHLTTHFHSAKGAGIPEMSSSSTDEEDAEFRKMHLHYASVADRQKIEAEAGAQSEPTVSLADYMNREVMATHRHVLSPVSLEHLMLQEALRRSMQDVELTASELESDDDQSTASELSNNDEYGFSNSSTSAARTTSNNEQHSEQILPRLVVSESPDTSQSKIRQPPPPSSSYHFLGRSA